MSDSELGFVYELFFRCLQSLRFVCLLRNTALKLILDNCYSITHPHFCNTDSFFNPSGNVSIASEMVDSVNTVSQSCKQY